MRTPLRICAAATALVFAAPAHADFYLVASNGSPQQALTRNEAVDLYMGRRRALNGGDPAQVLDLPRDRPERAAFYQALTGLGLAQVNSYWARLMFSGQTLPPRSVADEAAMVAVLERHADAIGWLTKAPTDKALRTLLVVKESP